MHRMYKLLLGFAAVWLSVSSAQAADPSCEYFKTNAPILDVLKDPNKVGDYVGELQRGDIVCISQKRKIGRRTWGLVKHVRLDGGKTDKLGGWVGLRFMKPHEIAASDAAPKTASPTRKTAPSSPYTPAKKAATKSKAELDREAEIAYWNTVRESNDPELIVSYLAQYPNGTFAKLARLLLDKLDRGGDRASSKQYNDDAPTTKTRDRKVSKPSRTEQRRASERRRKERARAEQRRAERDRAERRRRDRARRAERRRERARRAERRREQQARDRRRAQRDRPRRKRKPRCRMETRFECIKRGGTINSSGDCNVDRICR